MSVIKTEDQRKWINAFVVLSCAIVGYLTIQGTKQLGEWFDLEAKVQYFEALIQGTGIFSRTYGIFDHPKKSNKLILSQGMLYGTG